MTTKDQGSHEVAVAHDEQIGKVFAVHRNGLLECLVCGEIFSRETAAEHADVDCYRLELWLLESEDGGEHVT